MLKEDNIRTGFVEDAEHRRLAAEANKDGVWMRTQYELGYNCGWRHEELLGLRVKQMSIADRTIRLNPGETKNDQGRLA